MESGHPRHGLVVMVLYGCQGISTPSGTCSASVLGMFLLLPHPKPLSPRVSLCTPRSLVVRGLLSPGWDGLGTSRKIKSGLQEGTK